MLRYILTSGICDRIHAQETWLQIGRAVVFYARPAHAFSVGIKCRYVVVYCMFIDWTKSCINWLEK